jgi:hypothetical protein
MAAIEPRTELERRIDEELRCFRKRVLCQSRRKIYELGFRIQATERLGSLLKERIPSMEEEQVWCLLKREEILVPFYEAYVRCEDGTEEAMQRVIDRTLQSLAEKQTQ